MSDSRIGEDYASLLRRIRTLERQVDDLSILREVGLAVSSTLDLNEALNTIVNVVQGALEVKRIAVYQYYKKDASLHPLIAKHEFELLDPEQLREEVLTGGGNPLARSLETRSVYLGEDGQVSEAFVPLFVKQEAIGVLALQGRKDDRPFNNQDQILLQQVGAQISVALYNARLYAMAVTDSLTGLYVRRYFDLRLEETFASARRYGRPFSILLLDIDHFKQFNDTHGHHTGDLVLRQFAKILIKNTRSTDICCRYGGEEMVILLPETKMDEAALLGNKLCSLIRKHSFQGMDSNTLQVTTSIGVACFDDELPNAATLVQWADTALYQAKELGRNRIELAKM